MTTIAYHHKSKKIAVDSRTTKGGSTIVSDRSVKYIKNEFGTWFLTGDFADFEAFMSCFNKETEQQPVTYNASAILIHNGSAYSVYMDDGYFCKFKIEDNECKGSGELLALAAMDFGCSAKDAVEYAKKRDVYTGGKVRVFDV